MQFPMDIRPIRDSRYPGIKTIIESLIMKPIFTIIHYRTAPPDIDLTDNLKSQLQLLLDLEISSRMSIAKKIIGSMEVLLFLFEES